MTEKQVGIDAELALAVSLCSGTLTDCSVLIRLHNIAEEFEVIRAMKMIRNILPAHAATNPRLALGFALRKSPIDRTLAHHAIVHFDKDLAVACDAQYWAIIERARREVAWNRKRTTIPSVHTLHLALDSAMRAIVVEGCKPDEADYWQRVALHFLAAVDNEC